MPNAAAAPAPKPSSAPQGSTKRLWFLKVLALPTALLCFLFLLFFLSSPPDTKHEQARSCWDPRDEKEDQGNWILELRPSPVADKAGLSDGSQALT